MTKRGKHITEGILVLLLFQLVAPSFQTIMTPDCAPEKGNALVSNVQQQSMAWPIFLREKDEVDSKEKDIQIAFTSFIDFTDHVYILTQSHEIKLPVITYKDHYNHEPALFTLFGVFLI